MRRQKRIRLGILLCIILVTIAFAISSPGIDSRKVPINKGIILSVDGMVTAGTTAYLRRGIEQAVEQRVDLPVIKLNTPEGLVDATLDIVQNILNSPVPVVTFVAPRGDIAASAGTFIMFSGHVAVMSVGSTCGAAMPVYLQPVDGETRAADDKTITCLAGHMRSIAREKGRPADAAERFVTENLTLDAREALELGIADMIADDLMHLLRQRDGYTLEVRGQGITLQTRELDMQQ